MSDQWEVPFLTTENTSCGTKYENDCGLFYCNHLIMLLAMEWHLHPNAKVLLSGRGETEVGEEDGMDQKNPCENR